MDQSASTAQIAGSPRGGRVLFTVLLIGLSLGFVEVNRVRRVPNAGFPLTVDDTTALDIGDRWEGQAIVVTVPIRNRANQSIRVAQFRAFCSCVSVEPKQVVVPASGTAILTMSVQLKPSPQSSHDTRYRISVIGYGGDGHTPLLVVNLHGRVDRLLNLESRAVDVPRVLVRGETSAPVQAIVQSRLAGTSIEVESTDEVFATVRRSAKTERSYDLSLQIRPARAGRWMSSVSLVVKSQNGTTIARQSLPITAEVTEPVFAIPSTYSFGVVRSGTRVDLALRLVSATGAEFTVERYECTDGLVVTPVDTRFNYSLSMSVSIGNQSGEATFFVRLKGDKSAIRIPVLLNAYGEGSTAVSGRQ